MLLYMILSVTTSQYQYNTLTLQEIKVSLNGGSSSANSLLLTWIYFTPCTDK